MTETPVASLEPRLQKLVESARNAFERGEIARTINICGEILAGAPACAPVRKLQRTAQWARKRGTGAQIFCTLFKIVVLPVSAIAALTLSRQPLRTLRTAEWLLAFDPRSVRAWRLLGDAALVLDWAETAVIAFDAIREISPQDQRCLVALGRAHLAAGRETEAVRLANDALRREPLDGSARELLKEASVAQGVREGRWETQGDFRSKVRS